MNTRSELGQLSDRELAEHLEALRADWERLEPLAELENIDDYGPISREIDVITMAIKEALREQKQRLL